MVAAQAMEKIDPEWVRSFIPRSGLERCRIFDRTSGCRSGVIRDPAAPIFALSFGTSSGATTTSLKENCQMEIPEMTLGGGIAVCEQSLYPGSIVGAKDEYFVANQ